MITHRRVLVLEPSYNWWLSGGIPYDKCIAAYQPFNAGSYVNSLINLANPGTYNAAEGSAPNWCHARGWTFNGISNYLTTGITDADGWSWIISIKNGTTSANSTVFGTAKNGSPYEGIAFTNCLTAGPNHQYKNGAYLSVSGAKSTGIFAAAGKYLFENGKSAGTVTNSGCTGLSIPIGCLLLGTSRMYYYLGDVLALALWNTIITGNQVTSVTNAITELQTSSIQRTLVTFGDSVTAGIGASDETHRWANLVASGIGARLYNSGISSTVLQNTVQNSVSVIGAAAANNGRDTYAARVNYYLPSYVVILYGLNDLRLNDVAFSDTNFSNDLGEVVDGIVAAGVPAAQIVIGSPSYIPAASYALNSPWDGGSAIKHAAYVAACASVATAKGCKYADVYQAMADGGGDTLMDDDFHPNDAGHAVIAAAILAAL